LSFRDIEDLLAERGIIVTHEAIRQWCLRFGREYANSIRRRRPQPGDKWHLDEVIIKVCGETHYPWRAVDQDGNVLDILVQSQRKAKAATRFFRRLLKGLRYAPRVMISDKLASYGAARKQMRLSIEHRQHKLDENTYVDAAFLRGSEPRQALEHRIAAA
jgi:putative transposase